MIADDETPLHARSEDDRQGAPGIGAPTPMLGVTRPVALHELEAALQHVANVVLNTVTQNESRAAALVVRENLSLIVDGLWAAHHYRQLGHRPVDGDAGWHVLTSWVPTNVVQAGDDVVRRLRLQ